LGLIAQGDESWVCWSASTTDSFGYEKAVTRCRIAGSALIDYADGESPPVRLQPMVGFDANGSCWYWTSAESPWRILGYDDQGRAVLAYYLDPNGPPVIEGLEPACTSEPVPAVDPLEEAYSLLATYRHPLPDPRIDPPPGRGVTGMQTFVSLTAPPPWSASLTSPITGRTISVETWVEAVEIDWGDGTTVVVPVELLPHMTGYPDGAEPHVYEKKTCPDCVPYRITVRYVWNARWRVDSAAWSPLPVGPTSSVVDYPVSEIVSTLTDVG
jgi:hypothetical protein